MIGKLMAANRLAYSVRSGTSLNNDPSISVGFTGPGNRGGVVLRPSSPIHDDSYWIAILNANNPKEMVKDWIVPGQNNTTVPSGLDTYMNNTGYLFSLTTQTLKLYHLPQGDFYDFVAKHGAGTKLQELEQLSSQGGSNFIGMASYILTGQCGPHDQIAPQSYEASSYAVGLESRSSVILNMSLSSQQSGQPPYGLMDTYTFHTR
jgi:hypothetical protein